MKINSDIFNNLGKLVNEIFDKFYEKQWYFFVIGGAILVLLFVLFIGKGFW